MTPEQKKHQEEYFAAKKDMKLLIQIKLNTLERKIVQKPKSSN